LLQSKVWNIINKTFKLLSFLGDATIIVALYEYMHTVDVADKSGRTPLHYAAIVDNEETLTTLLLCNPEINRISKDGTTPLHEAIIHNNSRM
jgi:ankyrin repeat protein